MDIKTFLNPVRPTNEVVEVQISDRYVDENGEPVKFKIKTLSANRIQELQQAHTKISGKKNKTTIIDTANLNDDLIVESLVEPNLKSKELQDEFKVMGGNELIPLLFNTGEYFALIGEIYKINGLSDDINDDIELAKN